MAGAEHARRGAVLLLALLSIGACGSTGAAPPVLSADPQHYLLTLTDLATPGFSVADPAHAVDGTVISNGSQTVAQRLAQDGLQAAASVRFFRSVELSTSNGPVDVIDTVERFASAAGAADVFSADTVLLDSASGAAPLSTGSLGDQAHADSILRTTSAGVPAIQLTVEWRVANVVSVLVVRGRYGGTRLDDALTLASRSAKRQR